MKTTFIILWFIAFLFTLIWMVHLLGFKGLTDMFPEGRRRWHSWAQCGAILAYSLLVAFNPWRW